MLTVVIAVYLFVLFFIITLVPKEQTDIGDGGDYTGEIPPPDQTGGRPGVQSPSDTRDPNGESTDAPTTPPDVTYIDYYKESGKFDLPIEGASGYASIPLNIMSEPSTSSTKVGSLVSGECFRIAEESGDWWRIVSDNASGWVTHRYCYINLPDVIPSAVYYDSNAKSSLFVSSGYAIDGITAEKLYNAYSYNERLGREEFIMPILYSMAPKICAAQHAALDQGKTLIIYEAFRPLEVQMKVVKSVSKLMNEVPKVKEGIATAPWSISWFIMDGVSNHQMGYAFDVTLGDVVQVGVETIGSYKYTRVLVWNECQMQTAMHELSRAAVSMDYPVNSLSDSAWRNAPVASTMNEPALLLRKICTGAGLTPLASEWWHFNDLESYARIANSKNIGDYYIDKVSSIPPPGR